MLSACGYKDGSDASDGSDSVRVPVAVFVLLVISLLLTLVCCSTLAGIFIANYLRTEPPMPTVSGMGRSLRDSVRSYVIRTDKVDLKIVDEVGSMPPAAPPSTKEEEPGPGSC